MSKENLGACGLVCLECGAYIAYKTNNQELRKKVSEKWSRIYNHLINENDINCVGCMKEGLKFPHCSECNIRKCVNEHKINHCAECNDFVCKEIENFMNLDPQINDHLIELREEFLNKNNSI